MTVGTASSTPPTPISLATLKPVSRRLALIDVAKGIGILLIVLGHNSIFNYYFYTYAKIIATFRIPFFFFISGVTLSVIGKSFWQVTANKSDAWLRPWAVVVILVGLFKVVVHDDTFEGIAMGLAFGTGFALDWVPMWFLPTLWLTYTFSAAIVIYLGKFLENRWSRAILLVMLCAGGYFFVQQFYSVAEEASCRHRTVFESSLFQCGLPFSADLVLITSFYFLSGYFVAKWAREFRINLLTAAVCAAVLLGLFATFRMTVDLNQRLYDHLVILPLQAFCGIYLMLCVSFLLSKVNSAVKLFAFLGKASLFILIFHQAFINVIHERIGDYRVDKSIALSFGLAEFILPVLASIGIWLLCRKIHLLSLLMLPPPKMSKARA